MGSKRSFALARLKGDLLMQGYVRAPGPDAAGPPPFMTHGPGFPGPGFHSMMMAHMAHMFHMSRAEGIAHVVIGIVLLAAAWFVFTKMRQFMASSTADQQRYVAPIYLVVVLVLFLGGLLNAGSARSWAAVFSPNPQVMIQGERHMGPGGGGMWRPPMVQPSAKP